MSDCLQPEITARPEANDDDERPFGWRELRARVATALLAGATTRQIRAEIKCSKLTISDVRRELIETNPDFAALAFARAYPNGHPGRPLKTAKPDAEQPETERDREMK